MMKQLTEARNTLPATYVEIPYNGAPDQAAQELDSRSLIESWRGLQRRKGLLVLIASAGALSGFLVTVPQPPIYQARTSLEIVGLNDNFLNGRQVNPLDSASSSEAVDIQTHIKILQTDSLLDRVMEKVTATPDKMHRASIDAREQAVVYARKHVNVRSAAQTRIIEVAVDSMIAETAATFATTLANEFIDQNLQSRLKTTEQTGAFLARQIDDVRIRLEDSEEKLQVYGREAGLIFTDEKTNISGEKLLQVQAALSTAQTERIAKQSRWEIATSSPAEALPDILNDAGLRDYQAKLTELHRQRAELRTAFTPEHARVKRVDAEIETLEAALTRERGNIVKRIRNEYDEARSRERLLTANYGAQRGVVAGEGEKAVQYNILKREVDSNRQLYDAMLQQLKQATLASALRASNVRVVDPARVPKLPYKPNAPLSTAMGLFSGIFLGVAFVIFLERADRRLRYPGESTLYVGLPELGVIPSATGKSRFQISHRNGGQAKLTGPKENVKAAGRDLLALREDAEPVTFQRKPSMIAESFRATLASILFSGENGNRPRVMVVTSSNSAEGKSTVVRNLGIAAAEVHQRVLLIDADLHKPRLHQTFGLKNDRGLTDLLLSKDSSASLREGLIQGTSAHDLFVLTSGSSSPAATSLLYSTRMPDLLKILRTEFDMIFIDTPPMFEIADARVLGRMADGVILVLRAGKTTRDAAQAARERLSDDGTRILGTVLNDWDPKHSPNARYGYCNSNQ